MRLLRLIAEDAMAMHAEMVSAGEVEESNDPIGDVRARCGARGRRYDTDARGVRDQD